MRELLSLSYVDFYRIIIILLVRLDDNKSSEQWMDAINYLTGVEFKMVHFEDCSHHNYRNANIIDNVFPNATSLA